MHRSSPAMNILLFSVERAITRILELDPATQQRVHTLGQKCIKTHIRDWNITIYLVLNDGNIELVKSCVKDIDCDIECSRKTLFNLFKKDDKGRIHLHEDAILSGDADLLINLYQIFADVAPDYEAPLSHWLGPVVTHQLGRSLRSGTKWVGSVFESIADDIKLYVQEESGLFPHPLEAEDFYAEICQLENEVSGLTDALSQLQSAHLQKLDTGTSTDQRGS